MDLSKKERGILQRIIGGDAMVLLQRIGSGLLVQWNQSPIDFETEFLTAKAAIGREERKKALNSFLQTLENLANDNE